MPSSTDRLSAPAHDLHERAPTPHSVTQRRLDIRPKKNRKASAPLQIVFVGVAVRERPDLDDKGTEYAVSVSDGSGTVQSEHNFRPKGENARDALNYILDLARKYTEARGHKIQIMSFARTCSGLVPDVTFSPDAKKDGDDNDFLTRVWLELDAIPFLASSESCEGKFSLDAQAGAAIDEALATLVPMSSSTIKIQLSPLREVLVDADFRVHLYSLPLLKSITSPALWHAFSDLGSALAQQKTSVAFFSATPRGGGVALMRHSLMRIWHATGLDVRWYVPGGDPSVFNITKRKFHNVLQGVADEDVLLHDDEKKLFEAWTAHNYELYWAGEDSPLKRLDIAVIDDPQLTALIPIIRRVSPRTKIVFRSHIQIRADLIDKGDKQIKATWDYLWSFIKLADVFVAHPVEEFVPKVVRDSMPVIFMPPSTDPIDGLNKPLSRLFLEGYRHTFEEAVRSSSGAHVNWGRGYILQVARFDPSKGIPHLVEGYRLFREHADKTSNNAEHVPQLILTGHSSVDDPDGTLVLHQLHDQIADDKFASIRDDIIAIRAPPSDRLLNAMMRGADVVAQVSTREGYEVKVSEAVHKGKWMIASKAGGIPLQIREGKDGELVEPADPEGIANALINFYSSDKLQLSKSEMTANDLDHVLGGRFGDDGDGPSERDLSLGNATMWHVVFARLLGITGHVDLSDSQRALCSRLGIDVDGTKAHNFDGLEGEKVWEVLVRAFDGEKKRSA
ncbi:glycosyltransferase family 4 protein [Rhodotorula graminis WP1]|uniref:Glycosyltransferase family 4 protein n=1 Tax=Rhodotorula graminis (strain WP1) TaxID=578459 RepID=A0A194SE78_RHOGW|nr:glycosyltransferase family 4 protein [Rhodotorula graminis WP1]KPV77781.1 glycosyltransferase family 4 protein [Rhodotorula graminis WP1]